MLRLVHPKGSQAAFWKQQTGKTLGKVDQKGITLNNIEGGFEFRYT